MSAAIGERAEIPAKSFVVGVVLGGSTMAPWQAACLHTLTSECGATLRLLTETGGPWRGNGAGEAAEQDIDLALLLPENPLVPEALPPSKWGCWQMAYGFRAGLHAEIADVVTDLLAHRTTAEVHVVRLGADGHAEQHLYSATTRIWPWSPARSIQHLRSLLPHCLRAAILRHRERPKGLIESLPVAPLRRGRRSTRWPQRLLLAVASKTYLAHAYAWRLMFFREQWCIGIVDTPAADLVRGERAMPAQWLPNPDRFTYRADPICGSIDGRPYLLAEEFNCWRSKGIIVASPLRLDGMPEAPAPLFAGTAHLSYPFLSEIAGEAWLCPEAWETGKVERHRISHRDGALSVGPGETLLADWPGIEPTIFWHGDTWWMFCGNRSDTPNENLHLWFSDRLEGPWSPHPWNPVVTDIRQARPAGPVLMVDEMLVRPAQDCSATYGGALAFMRIDCLTRTAYRETLLRRLQPDRHGPWPHGLHTIGALGQRTVIDGKRWVASPLNPLIKLVAFIRNRKRRAPLRGAAASV